MSPSTPVRAECAPLSTPTHPGATVTDIVRRTMSSDHTPQTKLSAVQAAMRANNWPEALRLAAKFQRLGAERDAILEAHTAAANPQWTRQLRKNPDALIEAGRLALIAKYGYGEDTMPAQAPAAGENHGVTQLGAA